MRTTDIRNDIFISALGSECAPGSASALRGEDPMDIEALA
jgi:hypothetical protein